MKTPLTTEYEPAYEAWAIIDADGNWLATLGTHSGLFDKKAESDAREFVAAVNMLDAMAGAAAGLYDTVQDLRHVINGALAGESAEIPDDVRLRCQERIQRYKTALALTKEAQR